jgi:hypothetical protein
MYIFALVNIKNTHRIFECHLDRDELLSGKRTPYIRILTTL